MVQHRYAEPYAFEYFTKWVSDKDMVLSTVTNLDVFVEGVTAHWPLLLWENFVKEKKWFSTRFIQHSLTWLKSGLATYIHPEKKSLRVEERTHNKINLNMAYPSTYSFSIIQELRSRIFLQITSFLLLCIAYFDKNYFANLKRGIVMKSA